MSKSRNLFAWQMDSATAAENLERAFTLNVDFTPDTDLAELFGLAPTNRVEIRMGKKSFEGTISSAIERETPEGTVIDVRITDIDLLPKRRKRTARRKEKA